MNNFSIQLLRSRYLKISIYIIVIACFAITGFYFVAPKQVTYIYNQTNSIINSVIEKSGLNENSDQSLPASHSITHLHNSSNYIININDQSLVIDPEENHIYAGIIQHHLLAKSLIQTTLATIAQQRESFGSPVRHIVLLAPNHFEAGDSDVITSDGDWLTRQGRVAADIDLIEKLTITNHAAIDYQTAEEEHGIAVLIPFIKHYFPEAKITPLILKPHAREQSRILGTFLHANLPEDSLVLVSADFSHYLPKDVALFHDQSSITALRNMDDDFTYDMDVDTPDSINALYQYLQLKGAERFVLTGHDISFSYTRSTSAADSTSYVSGYFTAGEKQEHLSATLLAVGDMMLDRDVFMYTKRSGTYSYPFELMDLFIRGVNIRVGNLEGPITNNQSRAIYDYGTTFTFSPNFAEQLGSRFEVLSLANNHSLNFGENGYSETLEYLNQEQVGYFGHPYNNKNLSAILTKNGLRIGFIGYHSLYHNSTESVAQEIKRIHPETDIVIVYAHWGSEYQRAASQPQKQQAHAFIDAGADIILGAHPHVMQPIEIYNGKPIFYSLGNYIFDQYFSEHTMQGLSIGMVIEKEYNKINQKFYIFPILISRQCQPYLPEYNQTQDILQWLSENSHATPEIKSQIQAGIFAL